MTGDAQLKPYTSWTDLVQNLKHPESLINFIAAYGTHSALTAADVDTMAEMRAVATALVLGGSATINAGGVGGPERVFTADTNDRLDFLNSTGIYANLANGVTTTGVDAIDFWIGGLAEEQMPFGGLLGSTFNFVFETQLENLQNADRFYYLSRTAGLNFGTELEGNSFAQLVQLNTDATHLPGDIFSDARVHIGGRPDRSSSLAWASTAEPTRPGELRSAGSKSPSWSSATIPILPDRDTNYLHYIGEPDVVLGGTAGNDILIAGSSDDDTIWGDAGNDYIDGGFGDDNLLGGDGDDIIQDKGGDDNIKGGAGNDVIEDGHSIIWLGNIILGGDGKDFIVTREDISTIFGGAGDDFILGNKVNLPETGNEGDDWIETGMQDGAPGDNFSPFLLDNVPGNDIFVGGGGFDEMIGEGGDDIFVGSDAQDKMDGMSGYDWVTYKADHYGVSVDLTLPALNEPPIARLARIHSGSFRRSGGAFRVPRSRTFYAATISTPPPSRLARRPWATCSPTSVSSAACKASSARVSHHIPAAISSSAVTAATSSRAAAATI